MTIEHDVAGVQGRLGLVAGGGGLPRQVADACMNSGRPFFVVRLKGFADPFMSEYPGVDVGLGEFGKAFKALKAEGCRAVCFAGAVSRPDFSKLKPDLRGMVALPALMAAARRGDDAILRQVLWEFEREGFEIEGAHLAVAGMTMAEGAMGKIPPRSAPCRGYHARPAGGARHRRTGHRSGRRCGRRSCARC